MTTDGELRERISRSNRTLLWLAGVVGILVLIGVGVFVYHALQPTPVDIAGVEQQIRDGVKDQSGTNVTVDCPDSIDWDTGGEFHCIVEDNQGNRATATVSMENDDGEITWRIE